MSGCKSCKSGDITTENFERICTNCGEVQEDLQDADNQLCTLPDNQAIEDNFRNKNYEANQRLTKRIRGETNSALVRKQINRERLMDEVKRFVKQLIKEPRAVDETIELISSTFNAYQGRLLNSKKLGLIGACIYYLSAKHQLGITLTDISKVLNVKLKVINVCLKQVKQLMPKFEYERANIKDLVYKFIDELANKRFDMNMIEQPSTSKSRISGKPNTNAKISKESMTLIENKDRVVLQNRVMLMIDLFEAMHPYNQPTPQSLITAVVYHAWRSLDTFKMIAVNLSTELFNKSDEVRRQLSETGQSGADADEITDNSNLMIDERNVSPSSSRGVSIDIDDDVEQQVQARQAMRVKHSISYEKFCQICNLKYSSSGYKIVSKLQSSLLSLGQLLGDVNKINLPWYLKDIIENSPHLIQEHLRKPAQ